MNIQMKKIMMRSTTMNSCLILCRDLEIGYDGRGLLPPFDLSVEKGDFVVIAGPNGSGKSTLIKTVLGMIPPVKGSISFPEKKPVFGYVPQQKNTTADHPVTAFETVMMGKSGRTLFIKLTSKDIDDVSEKMSDMGIAHLKNKKFSALSGGQKQRVLLARALVANPDILILDEPTQGMDVTGESDILEILEKLNRQSGKTVILISHQLNTVSKIANRTIYINDNGLKEGN